MEFCESPGARMRRPAFNTSIAASRVSRQQMCRSSKVSSLTPQRYPYIVNWHLRESMTEVDIEVILERAKELHPEAKPRIISDNGPQFIAKDFKESIRISGMTHVRTSPYYPQLRIPAKANAVSEGKPNSVPG